MFFLLVIINYKYNNLLNKNIKFIIILNYYKILIIDD